MEGKVHMTYSHPFLACNVNEPVQEWTECQCLMIDSKSAFPLWKQRSEPHAVLRAPYCEGCYLLYTFTETTEEKDVLVRWLLFGVAPEIDHQNHEPLAGIKCSSIRSSTKKRIREMTKHQLHDSPSWKFLKIGHEIREEIKKEYPSLNTQQLNQKVKAALSGLIPIISATIPVPTTPELKSLVQKSGGRDILLGHLGSPVLGSDMALSFDHVEPCSLVR